MGGQVFRPDLPYRRNPQVALRPEPFGALAYHFGNRRLSFLKDRRLVDVVERLAEHSSVDEALRACRVVDQQRPSYLRALASLAQADMIVPRRPNRTAEESR
ncbi:mycofactocin biosynthesis chaperone MftB [Saccharopolyspora hordei]|uniref:Putative mycofactocin binding protein MftB n=1 Tax=Saccharopolyspora hordei TaxID=1838 RepID=A0A853AUM6_9PSEU|nr:mycofactocin biosynthesis chaperone MftB [Saccharopolyspora hordei]NYI86349.1 putative mycofactocin binding protein MftB [Saccharopolyspora hordei]